MNEIIRRFVVSAGIGILLAPMAWAQESNQAQKVENEVLVTATGWPVLASKTPGGTGILTRRDLEVRHVTTVADGMELVPGVARVADGTWASDVYIRGLSRDSVVMTVDGARVNTATDLGARFGLLSPDEIQTVEILKGPISSLYGSGTIGGAVNIITRKGEFSASPMEKGGFRVLGGINPDGVESTVRYAWNRPLSYVYISGGVRDYDSYEAGDGETVRNTQFSDGAFRVATGYRLNELHTLEFDTQIFRASDVGVPGSGTAPLPAVADVTYENADRSLVQIVDTIAVDGPHYKESVVRAYYQNIQRNVLIDAFPAANTMREVMPEGDHTTVGLNWLNRMQWGEHQVSAGVDAWNRHVDTTRERVMKNGQRLRDIPIPEADFLSSGLFAEDAWQVARDVRLSGGARADVVRVENESTPQWDAAEEEDVAWNLHLGCAWEFVQNWSLKMLGASGYRAASLEERFQYLQLGGGMVKLGDPELDPERSQFGEVGVEWMNDRSKVSLSGFVNDLTDMIGEVRQDETTFVNANVAEARIVGVELDVMQEMAERVSLYANLTWHEGKDTESDEYLAGISPVHGLGGIRYGAERGFWVALEYEFALRQDKVPFGDEEAPGWEIDNVMAGWRFAPKSVLDEVYVTIHNLWDRTYRDYLTTFRGNNEVLEPGQSIAMGVSMTF